MFARVVAEIRRSLSRSKTTGPVAEAAKSPQSPDLSAAFLASLRDARHYPKNLDYVTIAWMMAAMQSADYMVRHMMNAQNLVERMALLDFAIDQCVVEGLVLEFGVYYGESLGAIARRTPQSVHGFDSFEGLPEDWTYYQKRGRFGLDGKVPKLSESNIELHKGWFDATLPPFLETHPGAVRFLHIDCDLYSSTRTVLELLAPRIVSGTVILFDEYLNYPGWQDHEFKAFHEFVGARAIRYRYAGFASAGSSVALQVL